MLDSVRPLIPSANNDNSVMQPTSVESEPDDLHSVTSVSSPIDETPVVPPHILVYGTPDLSVDSGVSAISPEDMDSEGEVIPATQSLGQTSADTAESEQELLVAEPLSKNKNNMLVNPARNLLSSVSLIKMANPSKSHSTLC